ncbi:hypothetical protein PPERSA_02829 [Pseudocohnilembus persalinus]|uniref:Uncharacterized protein n=1 Tax=Pseudocohnilembus persalinus TaxID=266149 RepID=A0A0V0QMW0_PSEPJ|nr:hypothetical protein PPERSA_02829 [Pseudocohnilembus persalinus]|eukprot:KRX03450.1 hypothetical protein PPERSA_02829 [Pseudocohnilembus persalinus]
MAQVLRENKDYQNRDIKNRYEGKKSCPHMTYHFKNGLSQCYLNKISEKEEENQENSTQKKLDTKSQKQTLQNNLSNKSQLEKMKISFNENQIDFSNKQSVEQINRKISNISYNIGKPSKLDKRSQLFPQQQEPKAPKNSLKIDNEYVDITQNYINELKYKIQEQYAKLKYQQHIDIGNNQYQQMYVENQENEFSLDQERQEKSINSNEKNQCEMKPIDQIIDKLYNEQN